jgi:dTDP-4-amino-4,6-dideoxygalactose transaminase
MRGVQMVTTIKIPLIDLKRQIKSIENEIKEEVNKVISEGQFILGEYLERFEREFANYCGVNYAIGVGSGTDALNFSLKALGIGQGDEVLVPCNTFIATAEAITHANANPVFVDINPKTYNLDVTNVKLSSKVKAIIAVHLYGQPADMDAIKKFAGEQGIKVVEDACQAHGATYNGKKVGSLGDVGCFSFYPTKPLGCMGDGGMVTTNSEEIATKVKELRNHGRSKQNIHLIPGYTSRLDEIQAAVLLLKLKYMDIWNSKRMEIGGKYDKLLGDLDSLQTPQCITQAQHVYYMYVIKTKQRDRLALKLRERGIETSIYYPTPIHLQPAYKNTLLSQLSLRNGEQVVREILSIPMFAELKEEEIEYVCKSIRECL